MDAAQRKIANALLTSAPAFAALLGIRPEPAACPPVVTQVARATGVPATAAANLRTGALAAALRSKYATVPAGQGTLAASMDRLLARRARAPVSEPRGGVAEQSAGGLGASMDRVLSRANKR